MREISCLPNKLTLCFFGGFHAEIDGEALGIHSTKSILLLAYLAVEQNHTRRFSREMLAALLWSELSSPRVALNNLRQVLCNLRRQLVNFASLLQTDKTSIAFVSTSEVIMDVSQFINPVHIMRKTHEMNSDLLSALAKALDYYRGEFLAGFQITDCEEIEDWLRIKRESYHCQAVSMLETLSSGYEQLGDVESAIFYALRLVEMEPLQDLAQQRLMRLYAKTTRTTAALVQYENYREQLWLEHGIEPSDEIKVLLQAIKLSEVTPWDENVSAFAENVAEQDVNVILALYRVSVDETKQVIACWIDDGSRAYKARDQQARDYFFTALKLVMTLPTDSESDILESYLFKKIQCISNEKKYW